MHPIDRSFVHGRTEKLEGIPPLRLGGVHRNVGVLHQRLDVGAVCRVKTHADAWRGMQQPVLIRVRLPQLMQKLAGDGRPCRHSGFNTGEHDDELVTPEAGDDVAFSHRVLDPLRDLDQQCVASRMSKRVIDGLEAVQVDEHDGHFHAITVRGQQCLLKALIQAETVEQPGEVIMMRQTADVLFRRLAFRNIHKARNVKGDCAGRIAQYRNIGPLRIDMAIFGLVPQFALPVAGGLQVPPHRLVGFRWRAL